MCVLKYNWSEAWMKRRTVAWVKTVHTSRLHTVNYNPNNAPMPQVPMRSYLIISGYPLGGHEKIRLRVYYNHNGIDHRPSNFRNAKVFRNKWQPDLSCAPLHLIQSPPQMHPGLMSAFFRLTAAWERVEVKQTSDFWHWYCHCHLQFSFHVSAAFWPNPKSSRNQ